MPEIIDLFTEDFNNPVFLAMNDFAPTLRTTRCDESPFWDIPTGIGCGDRDNFTSRAQVDSFLRSCNPHGAGDSLKEIVRNTQGHDSGAFVNDHADQEEGPYFIENALNYDGLWAMTGSMTQLRANVLALGDDASR